MTTNKAHEIAESFINGNISWVKERVKSKANFVAVYNELKRISKIEAESFMKVCGS